MRITKHGNACSASYAMTWACATDILHSANLVPRVFAPLDQRSECENLWKQPFWKNKGNSWILPIRFHCAVCIYCARLKWLLPECLVFQLFSGQGERRLWERGWHSACAVIVLNNGTWLEFKRFCFYNVAIYHSIVLGIDANNIASMHAIITIKYRHTFKVNDEIDINVSSSF